ncbi:hypothetical protein GCM10010377_06200 [Streptomyces viridiviolaceus]|uniref:DUF7144 domain-containing protein n=1 Tax=Streptomyces viridiviolaceus TaxID=68282 RepID=A0ABW2E0R0_9ACTN|nr:hypothetical protein [Streptomyces viridiviolaceus]GHB19131.1 hypothetical protein GCM10010377_06200 [Streptomyces viridiviolaceus]
MSQHAASSPGAPSHGGGRSWSSQPSARQSGWVTGGVVFAGVLMLCNGALSILQGIAAIAEDDVYARIGTYVYEFSITGWGVVHVILGALVLVTGYGLLKDMAWARFAGIFLAALSLVAQFLFLPYAPVWSVIMMAIDVFVIWALASRQDAAA